jgi:heat shock protein beta
VARSEESATPVVEGAADAFTAEQRQTIDGTAEKHEFQAEVGRLMDILIKYLYSNKEVFLRELISNGSDALDKLRFLALTDPAQIGTGDMAKLEIRISGDKKKRLLTIRDTGVGMTKEELIKNLGTIAKSGTTQFVDAMTEGAAAGKDPLSLIGQFGVGFYSVYLVADFVTVASKSNAADTQYIWESSASGTFTVAADPRGNTLGRGTEITLRLKEDATEFSEYATLQRIATKYSEFINFPIYVEEVRETTKAVPDEEAEAAEAAEKPTEEKKEGEEDVEVKEEDEKQDEEEKKPKTKNVTEIEREWHLVNEQKPIWTRSPKDVSQEEYNAFYKALTKDHEDPLTHIHFTAEGDVSFRALLYVPKKAAADMYDKYYGKTSNIKLYVRRVLIAEEFEELMPRYLSFVRGVVDSDDLPVNVNRESLQKSKLLQVIGKKLVTKVFAMMNQMAEKEIAAASPSEEDKPTSADEQEKAKVDATMYETFYKQFGKSVRLGLIEDQKNAKKLQKLLRYPSSKFPTKSISLQSYVDRMKKNQDVIYYVSGESQTAVEQSPFLERLTKRGFEVLFLTEPLDEYAIQQVTEYDSRKLQSITKEGLQIGKTSDKAKQRLEDQQEEFKPLCEYLQGLYGTSKVEKVIVSTRVSESPAVLVTAQFGWTANMERIMKAQALGEQNKNSFMVAKRTLEINARHPIVQEMKKRAQADSSDSRLKDLASLLYDAAALQSGFAVDDHKSFGERVYRVIAGGLDLPADAKPSDEEEEDEEEEPAAEAESESEEAADVPETEAAAPAPAPAPTPSHDEL